MTRWPLKIVKVIDIVTGTVILTQVFIGAVVTLPRRIIDPSLSGSVDPAQALALIFAIVFFWFGFGVNYRRRRGRIAGCVRSVAFVALAVYQTLELIAKQRYFWHPNVEMTISFTFIVSQLFALASLTITGESTAVQGANEPRENDEVGACAPENVA